MTEQGVPRRAFLTAAAATVAGAALSTTAAGQVAHAAAWAAGGPPRTDGPASPMGSVRLGVASYSLRKIPLDKTLEMIKALHTPYVNFKSVHVPYEKTAAELAVLRKQIEAAGFQIVGGGTITFEKDTVQAGYSEGPFMRRAEVALSGRAGA